MFLGERCAIAQEQLLEPLQGALKTFGGFQKTGFVEKSTSASAAQLIQKPKQNTNYQHVPSANFVQSDALSLAAGQRVEHQKFGFGEVVKMEGSAHNPIATVKFELNGEKKIMLNYAKLRIVE